jgi:hypothetical protein
MNPRKGLVLDANILTRAVLGRRVGELLGDLLDIRSDRRRSGRWSASKRALLSPMVQA